MSMSFTGCPLSAQGWCQRVLVVSLPVQASSGAYSSTHYTYNSNIHSVIKVSSSITVTQGFAAECNQIVYRLFSWDSKKGKSESCFECECTRNKWPLLLWTFKLLLRSEIEHLGSVHTSFSSHTKQKTIHLTSVWLFKFRPNNKKEPFSRNTLDGASVSLNANKACYRLSAPLGKAKSYFFIGLWLSSCLGPFRRLWSAWGAYFIVPEFSTEQVWCLWGMVVFTLLFFT